MLAASVYRAAAPCLFGLRLDLASWAALVCIGGGCCACFGLLCVLLRWFSCCMIRPASRFVSRRLSYCTHEDSCGRLRFCSNAPAHDPSPHALFLLHARCCHGCLHGYSVNRGQPQIGFDAELCEFARSQSLRALNSKHRSAT